VREEVELLIARMEEQRRRARQSVWPCDWYLHNRMADLYRAKLEGILRAARRDIAIRMKAEAPDRQARS
jgi:hypothetical protein